VGEYRIPAIALSAFSAVLFVKSSEASSIGADPGGKGTQQGDRTENSFRRLEEALKISWF
jgi:hypothetical protein